jgi:hypothetical protein
MHTRRAGHVVTRPLNCGVRRRNARRRSVLWHYVLFWITGGLFGVVWAYLMNRDIQTVEPAHFPNLRKLGGSMLAAFALYFGLFFYLLSELVAGREQIRSGSFEGEVWDPVTFTIAMSVALFLMGSWFYCLLSAAKFVRRARVPLPGNIVLFLLLLVYGISLPLVQTRLNRALANDA